MDNYTCILKDIKPCSILPDDTETDTDTDPNPGYEHEPTAEEVRNYFRNSDGSIPDEYMGQYCGVTAYPYITNSYNYPHC